MLGYNNRKRRVVVSRSSRSVTETVPDTIKDHTTMEFCISASGEMMKPAVINKKKFLDRSLDFLVMEENWHFCSQKSGWDVQRRVPRVGGEHLPTTH